MRILNYIYNSEKAGSHVECVLERLKDRSETIEYNDISATNDRDAAHRAALLTVGQAVRIGGKPNEIFDEDGNPDFSAGVMITENTTGRRELEIGTEALEVLRSEGEGSTGDE